MAGRLYWSSIKKPQDEPFREWDLETCDHCHSHIALTIKRCTQCGYERNIYDQNMINKVLAWRHSPNGTNSWVNFNQDQQQKQREQHAVENGVAAMILFAGGFVMFGIIGFFWDMGLTAGIIGGTALSIIPFMDR